MENPRTVSRFLVGLLISVLALALGFGICLRDSSVFAWALGFVAPVLIGCCGVSLVLAIEFAPLVWLLSRMSTRRRKGKL